LDARQKQIEGEFKESFNLPIIYFTQLMGLAFGLKSDALGLDKHFVDTLPLLTNTNAIIYFTPHPPLPLKGGGLGWG
jgi:heterodisulfide reductase subunit B